MLQENMTCHILFIYILSQQVVLSYIFIADSSNMFYEKQKYFQHDGQYSINSNVLDKVVATNLSNCIEMCDLYQAGCVAINIFQFSNGYQCEFVANDSDTNELMQNGNSTHLSKSRVIILLSPPYITLFFMKKIYKNRYLVVTTEKNTYH